MTKRKGKPRNPYRDERINQAVNVWVVKLMFSNVRKHYVNEIRIRVLSVFNTERKNLGAFSALTNLGLDLILKISFLTFIYFLSFS